MVVLGVMLAQSMSSTERSTTEIIAENRLDQEMIDTAVLAQADALQEFNFGMRSAMEKYFSNDYDSERGYENYYSLESDKWDDTSLDEITADFEREQFGTRLDSIAQFTEQELSSTLIGYKHTQEFLIRLQREDFDSATFQEILKKALRPATGNIIKVIDCPHNEDDDVTVDNCTKGTFYVTLYFAELSDEDYDCLLGLFELEDRVTTRKGLI